MTAELEQSRLTAARTALTVLAKGARLARHTKHAHPLAFPLHTAVLQAISDIHKPDQQRMGAYCRLLGVISCLEVIEHPATATLMELAALVKGILATESPVWIVSNQANAERISAAAQSDPVAAGDAPPTQRVFTAKPNAGLEAVKAASESLYHDRSS